MRNAPSHIKQMCTDILWHFGDDVNMNWGNPSTAQSWSALDRLSQLGFSVNLDYNHIGSIKAYAQSDVINSINNLRPVWMEGYTRYYTGSIQVNDGHAWLIDGYLRQRWWDIYKIDNHIYEVEMFRDFFHNNFGLNGMDNGYYICGLFDANNHPDLPSNTRGEWIGENLNYQFNLCMWTNIYK